MQFVVTTHDFTDDAVAERRRKAHGDYMKDIHALLEAEHFISGGPYFDAQEHPLGSSFHVCFESREKLDAWLNDHPFVLNKVWEKIEVHELKVLQLGE